MVLRSYIGCCLRKILVYTGAALSSSILTTDIEQLCDQIEGLNFEEEDDAIEPNDASDKKGKKKAKAEEIARLSKLGFIDIMKEAKDPKDVLFEPLCQTVFESWKSIF